MKKLLLSCFFLLFVFSCSNQSNQEKQSDPQIVDINKKAESFISNEKSNLEWLLDLAKSEYTSKEEREEYIRRLNEISPAYLGFLNIDNIGKYGDDAVTKYVDHLLKNKIEDFSRIYNPNFSNEEARKINEENAKEERINDSLQEVHLKEFNAAVAKLKPKFKEKYDEFKRVTWIQHKNEPKYANSKGFYLYMGRSDNGSVFPRLCIRYHGNDWLFLEKIIIKTDNKMHELDAREAKRDNNSQVWEWIDFIPDAQHLLMIGDIVNSKNTKVRFEGSQYYRDWTLTKKEIEALKDTRDYYYLLKRETIN